MTKNKEPNKDWVKDHQERPPSWGAGENEKVESTEPEKTKPEGRPKLEDSAKRKPRFTMNLNDEELALIHEAAKQNGQTQAAFARNGALQWAKKLLSE